MRRIFAIALALLPSLALGQTLPSPSMNGTNVIVSPPGGGTARSLPDRATDVIQARDFGTCTWDATHDVGPCINAAITKAAALGGRDVLVPAGLYGLSTPLLQTTSGVKLIGAGTGIPRDSMVPSIYLSATRLVWLGAAGATMLEVRPASTSVPTLYAADVRGITFDCASLANICVKLAQVSYSTFDFAAAEPRSIGVYVTTTLTADSPGVQHNDFWIRTRSTNAAYSPTGILLDGATGSNWNVSYNRFWELYSWFYKGDGIVFGNSDNNLIFDLATYANPGATGSSIIFAASGYVPPNGVPVSNGAPYTTRVLHTGSTTTIQGFTSATTVTAGGGNAGSASFAPVSLTTNAISASGISLPFASTTGVASNMNANCGTGGTPSSGVLNDTQVYITTPTIVRLSYPQIAAVASGTVCTFGLGVTNSAKQGTYTLTATGASTYNLTAPAGGTSQTGVSVSGGALSFTDMVFPVSGSAVSGDSWTIVTPNVPTGIQLEGVDKANAVPTPHFGPGATGTYQVSNEMSLTQASPSKGISLQFSQEQCGGTNPVTTGTAVNLGNCAGAGATGPFTSVLNGTGNSATGFGSTTVGGHNNIGAGPWSVSMGQNAITTGPTSMAFGESVTAGASYSQARGGYATDRDDRSDVWANGQFATQGDAQTRRTVLRRAIASTSATQLTVDGTISAANSSLRIPVNTIMQTGVRVSCVDTTNRANWAVWSAQEGALTRAAGSPAYAGAASAATTPTQSGGSASTATLTVAADTTNNVLGVSITWPNTNATHCAAEARTVEVQ